MRGGLTFLGTRLSDAALDGRVARLVCGVAGVGIVPVAVRALARNAAGPAEMLMGTGLAVLAGLLCVMLGVLCGALAGAGRPVPVRSRWFEFVCDALSVVVLLPGVRMVAGLARTPAQVVLGLLVLGSLSLGVIVCGMLTTVARVASRVGPAE